MGSAMAKLSAHHSSIAPLESGRPSSRTLPVLNLLDQCTRAAENVCYPQNPPQVVWLWMTIVLNRGNFPEVIGSYAGKGRYATRSRYALAPCLKSRTPVPREPAATQSSPMEWSRHTGKSAPPHVQQANARLPRAAATPCSKRSDPLEQLATPPQLEQSTSRQAPGSTNVPSINRCPYIKRMTLS